MYTIKQNKMSLQDCIEDIMVDYADDIYTFTKQYDPKKWRSIINTFQKKFTNMSESILETIYDEIGWAD